MTFASWLAEQFREPWLFPALLAIAAASIGARSTLKANIREKAWQPIYEAKRETVEAFLAGVGDFRMLMVLMTGAVGGREGTAEQRYANYRKSALLLAACRAGREPSAFERLLAERLPAEQDLDGVDLEEVVETAHHLVLKAIDLEMEETLVRITRLDAKMGFYARDPRVHRRLVGLVSETYRRLHAAVNAGTAIRMEDLDTDWNQEALLLRERLRKDLVASTRSLHAATRISLRWRAYLFLKELRLARASRRQPEA